MKAPIKLRLVPLGGRRWTFNLENSIPGWSHDRDICFGSTFVRWVEHSGQEELTAMIVGMSSDPNCKEPTYQVLLTWVRPHFGIIYDKFEVTIPETRRGYRISKAIGRINARVEWLFK